MVSGLFQVFGMIYEVYECLFVMVSVNLQEVQTNLFILVIVHLDGKGLLETLQLGVLQYRL